MKILVSKQKSENYIFFTKMEAAGNDFIIIFYEEINKNLTSNQMRCLCNRNTGIGGDGIVVLRNLDIIGKHVQWHFYNSDGSEAKMCGNAARCVAVLLFLHGHYGKFDLKTLNCNTTESGECDECVDIEAVNAHLGQIIVPLPQVQKVPSEFPYQDDVFYCDSGVPHVVVFTSESKQELLLNKAKEIRFHNSFGEEGTNVTFITNFHIHNMNILNNLSSVTAVTYERGVESFTESCGTGAIAAAFCLRVKKNVQSKLIEIKMPGGKLRVIWDNNKVSLEGPVNRVFEGVYYYELHENTNDSK